MQVLTKTQKQAKLEYQREWIKKNPEKVRAQQRAYRMANPEKVAESKRKHYRKNKEVILANAAEWRKNNPKLATKQRKAAMAKNKQRSKTDPIPALRNMITSARTRCKTTGREFTIDIEYIEKLWNKQKGLCKLSKLPMSTEIGSRELRVSLDRINNAKGYVKGNVQLLRSMVNNAKNRYTQTDFLNMCRAVAKSNPK
jgi:hypothetical protein